MAVDYFVVNIPFVEISQLPPTISNVPTPGTIGPVEISKRERDLAS